MIEIVDLNQNQVSQAQEMSHQLWSGGLTLEQRINRLKSMQDDHPEAFRYVGLVNGGETISSMKLYNCHLLVDQKEIPCVGLGAIYTRDDKRGQGYAAQLIQGVIEDAKASGVVGAFLWSDIGIDYYKKFGFEPYELNKHYYSRGRNGNDSENLFRLATGDDIDFQMQTFRSVIRKMSISTIRTKSLWKFYRELNGAKDHIVLDGRGNRIGYFSASKEKDLLWLDEAVAMPGYEATVWNAVSLFAAKEDAEEIYSWDQPFGILPKPVRSERVTKPIPMVKVFEDNSFQGKSCFFGCLDHF